MRVVLGVLAFLILAALGGVAWLYSGAYPVAATEPHAALGKWVLETAKRQSVRAHARGIAIPSLGDYRQIEEGARLFEDHCALCHGAPGSKGHEFASAMNPAPPLLSDVVGNWTSAELFWIISNGLRMTGMPAWGSTHMDDGEIWSLVAFINQLPTMDAARYRAIVVPEPSAPTPEEGQQTKPHEHPEAPSPAQPEPAPQPQPNAPGPGPTRLIP